MVMDKIVDSLLNVLGMVYRRNKVRFSRLPEKPNAYQQVIIGVVRSYNNNTPFMVFGEKNPKIRRYYRAMKEVVACLPKDQSKKCLSLLRYSYHHGGIGKIGKI